MANVQNYCSKMVLLKLSELRVVHLAAGFL